MRYATIILAALAGLVSVTQASPVLAERASSSFSGANNYYAYVFALMPANALYSRVVTDHRHATLLLDTLCLPTKGTPSFSK